MHAKINFVLTKGIMN